MGFVPVMWTIWGGCVVLLAAVHLYQARLGRDEEDQIFLGEGFTEERSAQVAIAAKVNKVQPIKKLVIGLLGVMTVFVIGYYVFDVVRQFK